MSGSTRDERKDQKSGVSRRKFLAGSAMALGAAGLSLTAPGAVRPAAAKSDETYVWLCAVTAIAFWIDGRQGFEAAGKALGASYSTGRNHDFSGGPPVSQRTDEACNEGRYSRRNRKP